MDVEYLKILGKDGLVNTRIRLLIAFVYDEQLEEMSGIFPFLFYKNDANRIRGKSNKSKNMYWKIMRINSL
jgi:hypothetical protein